jgi:hypothetical protein
MPTVFAIVDNDEELLKLVWNTMWAWRNSKVIARLDQHRVRLKISVSRREDGLSASIQSLMTGMSHPLGDRVIVRSTPPDKDSHFRNVVPPGAVPGHVLQTTNEKVCELLP